MWIERQSWLILAALLWPAPALAAEAVDVRGFVSQGLVHTTNNHYAGRSEDGVSWDMRELGLNLSYRPNGDWLFAAQVLSRRAGRADEGEVRVDYAFIDRTLASDASSRVSLQVGKVKNPYGFFNTTRDVAHTRPGILMPQSIYPDQIRNFFLAAPGVSLAGDHFSAQDAISWAFNVMRPEVDNESLTAYMLGARPGHFQGRPSWLGQVLADLDGGRWRVGVTLGSVTMRYRPAAPPPADLLAGTIRLDTGVLSLQRNLERVSLTAEYALTHQTRGRFAFAPALDPLDLDTTVEAAYVQADWRFRPLWSVYARHERFYIDRDDRDGRQFNALMPVMAAHQRFNTGWVLGLSRELPPGWLLSLELHDLDGTAWLPDLDQPDPGATRQHWQMLLFQAAYRF